MIKIITTSLVLTVFILMVSCIGQFTDLEISPEINISPELAIPLARGEFGLKDFQYTFNDKTGIITDSAGVLTLVYSDQYISPNASEYLFLSDQHYTQSIKMDNVIINALQMIGSYTFSKDYKVAFSIADGHQIDSIYVNQQNLNVLINNNSGASGTIRLTYYSMKSSEGIYSTEYPLNPFTSTSLNQYILPETVLHLTDSGRSSNTFSLKAEVDLYNYGNFIDVSQSIDFQIDLTDIQYQQLYGKFATKSLVNFNSGMAFDLFSIMKDKKVYFVDPRLSVGITNQVGLGLQFQLNNIGVSRQDPAGQLPFVTDVFNKSIFIDPVSLDNTPTSNKITLSFDRQTSNIDEMIAFYPDSMFYMINGTVSPGGGLTPGFIMDTSKAILDIKLELPLHGRAENITMEKTIPFTPDSSIVSQLTKAYFKVRTENAMPLQVDLQVYFLRDTEPLDSLFTEDFGALLPMPEMDQQGLVLQHGENTLTIEADEARLLLIREANNIGIKVKLNTVGSEQGKNIKITEDNYLNVYIGVGAKADLTFNLN